MKDMNNVARDLLSVRQMIAELKAEEEALVDALKAEMVEQGTETLTGDGWTAKWQNIESKRFDSKSFRTDHSDLYSQYSKPVTTCRFTLTA